MMKRDLAQLTSTTYDVLVVGGGITGACVAWDAALRGLQVALLEKEDFGAATSANSLKTVHGGLRYLQDADLRVVRKMIREREAFLRIAPHLVHPFPCVMPAYKNKFMRSKLVLGTALKLNDLIGFDRNFGVEPQRRLPNGRILSRAEILRLLPGLDDGGMTGGILWHDAQMYNSERLLLSFLLSAAEKGAQVANYVAVTDLLQEDGRVMGVRARDVLTGEALSVRARVVVNTAGPWVDEVTGYLNGHAPQRKFHLSSAMNLVTRQIVPEVGVGLDSHYEIQLPDGTEEKRSRMLFISPWRNYSIVGTLHAPYNGYPGDNWVTERTITDFIAEVNRAYPGANLKREDVYLVHRGFLPANPDEANSATVKLLREGRVYDHEAENGVSGLVTAVGVKYTTARYLAAKVVDLVFRKLGQQPPACRTHVTRLYGGQIEQFDDYLAEETSKRPHGMVPEVTRHLIYNYGSAYQQPLRYLNEDSCWVQPVTETTSVTKAEILHSVRAEMAQRLTDVVLRRTELGSAKKPDDGCVWTCARIMAAELGWDRYRVEQEIKDVQAAYELAA